MKNCKICGKKLSGKKTVYCETYGSCYKKTEKIRWIERRKNWYIKYRRSPKICIICKKELPLYKRKYCNSCQPIKIGHLALRFHILRRDNFKCTYCGRGIEDGIKLELDHTIPKSFYGSSSINNLKTVCRDCNAGKKDSLII